MPVGPRRTASRALEPPVRSRRPPCGPASGSSRLGRKQAHNPLLPRFPTFAHLVVPGTPEQWLSVVLGHPSAMRPVVRTSSTLACGRLFWDLVPAPGRSLTSSRSRRSSFHRPSSEEGFQSKGSGSPSSHEPNTYRVSNGLPPGIHGAALSQHGALRGATLPRRHSESQAQGTPKEMPGWRRSQCSSCDLDSPFVHAYQGSLHTRTTLSG